MIFTPGIEVWIRYRIHQKVELWSEAGTLSGVRAWMGSEQELRVQGRFIKLGANMPFAYLNEYGTQLTFGIRYGLGAGRETLTLDMQQPYWNTRELIEQSRAFTAQWMEYLVSAEKNFLKSDRRPSRTSLIVSVRVRSLHSTTSDPAFESVFLIPGYGAGNVGLAPDLQFGFLWRLAGH